MKNDYYVYVYLDQTKPGIYKYKEHTFKFKPFYVGKGTKNRETKHLCACMLKHKNYKNSIIKSIYTKTGEQPIHYRIYENITNEESIEIEKDFISFFGRLDKKTGILSNGTDGGDGANNFSEETLSKVGNRKKKVYQYGLDGVFIKCWDRMLDTKDVGLNPANICTSIKRGGTCDNYIWSYEYFDVLKKKIKYQMPIKIKDIKQIDVNTGYVLNIFKTINDAENYLKIKNSKIRDCINGKYKTAYGYKWSTEEIVDMTNIRLPTKIVLKYDEVGNLIDEYKSIKDAAKSISKAPNTLSQAISIGRLCGGYKWVFK